MKRIVSSFFLHLLLAIGAFISLLPFYWLFVMSTRKATEFMRYPPIFIPGDRLFINVTNLVHAINFGGSMLNTLFVAGVKTLGTIFFCAMAGFYFAKFKFPGNKGLFAFLLLTMMIPGQLTLVPMLVEMQAFGWVSTFKALIVPGLVGAFGIFWMRQYADGAIHDDLLNSGRIDGCNTFRLFWNIGFPILLPGISFLAIFTFMGAWNDYLWPLIVINDPNKYIIQVELQQLNGVYNQTDYGMVMAGTFLAMLPLIIIFLIFNKQIVGGIAEGAIKD